ncbi:MAG: hypothetical protein R3246_17695, partial [Acidimicrobiia bacterium]|nr:hypothetical protein [Acidimicrobiia bacterium]
MGLTVLPSTAVYSLAAPVNGPDVDSGVEEAQTASGPVQIELNDLTGIDIMWDRSHGQTSTSSWSTLIGDLEARGATVTENTDPITPALLAGYEVLWSVDISSSFDPAELTALADWVDAGGGLLLEGD